MKRDDDLKPVQLEIQRGRKKLFLDYAYSPAGDLHSLEFTGRRDNLPSIAEIMALVDKKRLDRIGTIELIDLITLIKKIELIDDITTIGTIGEISKIRDVVLPKSALILNPFFDEGLAGWSDGYGNVTVNYTGLPPTYMALFPDLTVATLDQKFGIPIGVDWMTEFYLCLFANHTGVNLIKVVYSYSDGTASNEVFQVAGVGWTKKTLAPTAGKYIDRLTFDHLVTYRECGVSYICTVF